MAHTLYIYITDTHIHILQIIYIHTHIHIYTLYTHRHINYVLRKVYKKMNTYQILSNDSVKQYKCN